ncbi:phage integrase SAM-like domain-containing protein [Halalkalicoccus salilacus]|uniref:phage integrase SAM-like domain-containing protein n=1 Tax=Halalkalicoccus sp. GCM10025704 TaxID=3252662 RepID=UPI00360C6327
MPDPQNQGSSTTSGSPSLQEGLTQFLKAKAKGDDSGNYRRNAKRVITRWIDWLAQRDIDDFEQLDETVLAHYAEHLRRRVAANEAETTDGGIARSTAWTYYNTVSAFLGWASKWGYLQENYARAGLAQESMPARSTSQQSQQQFWTPDQRTQILNYVNKRAHDAIDEKGLDANVEVRDRALVAVLAFTGVRAAEVFRSEHDNRTGRQGFAGATSILTSRRSRSLERISNASQHGYSSKRSPLSSAIGRSVIHQPMIGPSFRRDTRHRCINALGRIFAKWRVKTRRRWKRFLRNRWLRRSCGSTRSFRLRSRRRALEV